MILGYSQKQQKETALQALQQVGLAHKMHSYPQQLSGGEQQRVAIARALISKPKIVLADEPTGNLDPELSEEILRIFRQINKNGTTIIFATHDKAILKEAEERILYLSQGRLTEDVRRENS